MENRYVAQVPEYVTSDILERIKVMMADGKINPRHYLCDMTAEIAAGAPPKEVIEQMIRRNACGKTYSIYQRLFPQK